MKNLAIIILAVSATMFSCDDRFDFIADLNRNPSILFVKNTQEIGTLNDTLKTSIKHGSEFFDINVVLNDPEDLLGTLTYQVLEGNGTVYQAGAEVNTIVYDVNGRAQFSYRPSDNGLHKVKFIITDNLGNKGEAILNLRVFVNLKPIAVRSLIRIGVNNAFEYDLDGSASYDPDKNVGGGISFYEWDINGTKFLSPNKISRFIFPQSGTYEVKLRVIDNDGEYSDPVGGPLTLNN